MMDDDALYDAGRRSFWRQAWEPLARADPLIDGNFVALWVGIAKAMCSVDSECIRTSPICESLSQYAGYKPNNV